MTISPRRAAGLLPLLAVLAGVVAPSSASAATWRGTSFKNPSGTVFCVLNKEDYARPTIRCDVRKGPADRTWLLDTKRARRTPATDTVVNLAFRTMRAGRTWSFGNGLTCSIRSGSAVRCKNRAGRGFQLASTRQRVF